MKTIIYFNDKGRILGHTRVDDGVRLSLSENWLDISSHIDKDKIIMNKELYHVDKRKGLITRQVISNETVGEVRAKLLEKIKQRQRLFQKRQEQVAAEARKQGLLHKHKLGKR